MNINSSVGDLLQTLVDLIAIKAGILLDREMLVDQLRRGHDLEGTEDEDPWWQSDPEGWVRIRAEGLEFEFLVAMRQLGAIEDLTTSQDLIIRRLEELEIQAGMSPAERYAVLSRAPELVMEILGGANPEAFEDLAAEVRRRFILDNALPERRTWEDAIRLEDLYESEDIPDGITADSHFDQRFIDYLAANPGELENIHWRQFEYLCGEYFNHLGYEVEITPPRGDGGVDVIARRHLEGVGPELIVLQAKRRAGTNTVSIDEVKAFWTTFLEAGATRAVIATTTRLEAGGREFCEARIYRMTAAERDEVREWIREMHSVAE